VLNNLGELFSTTRASYSRLYNLTYTDFYRRAYSMESNRQSRYMRSQSTPIAFAGYMRIDDGQRVEKEVEEQVRLMHVDCAAGRLACLKSRTRQPYLVADATIRRRHRRDHRASLSLSLSLLNLLRFPRFHRAIIADAPVSPVISASRAGAGGSPEAASRVNTGAPVRPSTEQRTIRWLSG